MKHLQIIYLTLFSVIIKITSFYEKGDDIYSIENSSAMIKVKIKIVVNAETLF
jgi:hypothetical protein